MRQVVNSRSYALLELLLITLCGAVLSVKPEWAIWLFPAALLLFSFRRAGSAILSKPIDVLVLVFIMTAWVGYWAAYDHAAAWNKACWITIAGLSYFSLKSQPRENLFWISIALFCTGIGVSLYFFLTHDFITLPRKLEVVNKIGLWAMRVRPQVDWTPIHPNYVAGMISVTIPFIIHPLWDKKRVYVRPLFVRSLAVGIGLGIAGLALFMATSRGIVFAIFSGIGGWLIWWIISTGAIKSRIGSLPVFPVILMVYLTVIVILFYIGPANSGNPIIGDYFYGNGSRAELFSRSIYLVLAFPITGGGLASFPGLYSHYLLGIPFYNVPNSHNLFLDVSLEQGVFGGLAFLLIYLVSLWTVSWLITREKEDMVLKWVILFALIAAIIHGSVDDYIYNGAGSMFSLLLPGLAMNMAERTEQKINSKVIPRVFGAIAVVSMLLAVINLGQLRAIWSANLGAVQMARAELAGFPTSGWVDAEVLPGLDKADVLFQTALKFDPANRSANQRHGLILMYRKDFASAARYLETAQSLAPNHRGIIKALAYCYVWLGDLKKAQDFLAQIPEAREELGVYIWWWQIQGRNDLSQKAEMALDAMGR